MSATIHSKLEEIYADLSTNVTHIFGRNDLHLAIDLVYHSPIRFRFDGRTIKKAYPEVLIIGDTRTGKTQCAETLLQHYGCGATAQADAMSYAGLIGGCQKMFDKQWDITWGKLPQNNRRLVIIDEASGMDEQLMGALTSIRSSGIATIEKISSARTEAKTRILWLSNPRGKLTVGQFASGIAVVQSLTSQPEDIARWDFALIVSKDDVSQGSLRALKHTDVPHRYTAQLCHDLVLWAWTREESEIEFTEEAEEACYVTGAKLSEKYNSEFTLVIGAEQPLKMARLATALAARLFSTPDGHKLIVEARHVEYIYEYLQRVYDHPAFGYDTWSLHRNSSVEIADPDELIAFFDRIGRACCIHFLDLEKVRCNDLVEFIGISDEEARSILARLIANNALKRLYNDYYSKSKAFNAMLRRYVQTHARQVKPKVEGDGL
jgi:hypothetical protein